MNDYQEPAVPQHQDGGIEGILLRAREDRAGLHDLLVIVQMVRQNPDAVENLLADLAAFTDLPPSTAGEQTAAETAGAPASRLMPDELSPSVIVLSNAGSTVVNRPSHLASFIDCLKEMEARSTANDRWVKHYADIKKRWDEALRQMDESNYERARTELLHLNSDIKSPEFISGPALDLIQRLLSDIQKDPWRFCPTDGFIQKLDAYLKKLDRITAPGSMLIECDGLQAAASGPVEQNWAAYFRIITLAQQALTEGKLEEARQYLAEAKKKRSPENHHKFLDKLIDIAWQFRAGNYNTAIGQLNNLVGDMYRTNEELIRFVQAHSPHASQLPTERDLKEDILKAAHKLSNQPPWFCYWGAGIVAFAASLDEGFQLWHAGKMDGALAFFQNIEAQGGEIAYFARRVNIKGLLQPYIDGLKERQRIMDDLLKYVDVQTRAGKRLISDLKVKSWFRELQAKAQLSMFHEKARPQVWAEAYDSIQPGLPAAETQKVLDAVNITSDEVVYPLFKAVLDSQRNQAVEVAASANRSFWFRR